MKTDTTTKDTNNTKKAQRQETADSVIPRRRFGLRRPRLLVVFFSCFSCLSWFHSSARAADAGPRDPYRLNLVVLLGKHPSLTDLFRERAETELRDSLQASLGELAEVQVVRPDKDDPHRKEIEAKGLGVLDTWTYRSTRWWRPPVKTHFVVFDVVGDQFEVSTRQYDGAYAFASPRVRRRMARDRDQVVRAAALLVEHDLGLIGVAASGASGQGSPVTLNVQGGGLGVPLSPLVGVGEVFAVLQATPGKPGGMMPFALLRVEEAPQGGSCACRYFTRYGDPLPAGVRCIKLGTAEQAPLRLELTLNTQDALSAEVRAAGFDDSEKNPLIVRRTSLRITRERNVARTVLDSTAIDAKARFDHVAFVSIVKDDRRRAIIPVALIDDQPIATRIDAAAVAGDESLIANATRWKRDVDDAYFKLQDLYRQLNDLANKEDTRAEARGMALKGAGVCRKDHQDLTERRKALDTKTGALPPGLLAAADRHLRDLDHAETDLRKFAADLETAQKEDAKQREWKKEIARGLNYEQQLELGKAIGVYEKVLKEGGGNPELTQRVANLKRLWEPQGEEHKKARQFIYGDWSRKDLSAEDMKTKLPEARKAFETCKLRNDEVGMKKLFDGTDAQIGRLAELARDVHGINIGDREKLEFIQEVNKGLGELLHDVNEYLKSKEPQGM